MAREAAMERDRAQAALAQAQGTADYLESAILMGDPQSSEVDPPLSAVLDSAAARVDQEADPAVAAAIHRALASVYLGRGDTEKATHHAQQAVAGLRDTSSVDYAVAQTYWAQAIADGGDLEAALPRHEAAVQALGNDDTPGPERSVVLNTYAVTLAGLGQSEDAERLYREAIDAARRGGHSTQEATALQNLGALLITLDRPVESIALYQQVVEILRDAQTPESTYGLPFALANLASALSTNEQHDEALTTYREAIAAFDARLGDTHPEAIASRVTFALQLHEVGRFGDAVRAAEDVLARVETLPEGHPYIAYAQNVAGTALCDGGDPARGAQLHRTSLAARRQVFPPDHFLLANAESVLGACVARLGRMEEARGLLTRSAETLASSLGEDHNRTVAARERLAAFVASNP
ncbi:MAG: tetratricopeptide repeat protein [Bacteroidota bacterium]